MGLDPERDGFGGVEQGFIERIAGREAAGQIGKPDADGVVGTCILDDGDVMGHVSRLAAPLVLLRL